MVPMNSITRDFLELYDKVNALHRRRCLSIHPEFCTLSIDDDYYLDTLYNMKKANLGDFASAIGVTKPGVTKIVRRFLEKGYLVKTQSETDRRLFYITLAPEWQAYFDRLYALYDEVIRDLLQGLDEETIDTFADSLHRIAANARRIVHAEERDGVEE
ncbi:hypothetical protein ABB02_00597 [Clostridiaceae bacterium JG1575]|nr:hypothetical protein ABB02_00597 [Clostridiaceae bacterium JG1575]